MALQTYSFDQVIVTYGGIPLEGFADGDAISIEYPEGWTMQKGAGGAVTRSRVQDPTAMVTLRLQQTSPSNAVLAGFYEADRAARTSATALPLLIRDRRSGGELFAAQSGWVSQKPAMTFAEESGPREWTLTTHNAAGVPLPI